MITTKTLVRLVKAAMAVDVPAGMAQLNSNGCWVHVDDYEKLCKQVGELHAALERLKKEGQSPKKKRVKR